MSECFDRLVALRGDPVKGLPASAWETNLRDFERDQLLRAVIAVVRSLLLPEWEGRRPDDRRPHHALEATEAWIASKAPEALADTKEKSKACTAARNETFGDNHRVPEAARAVAMAATAKDNKPIWDALTSSEEELLARIAIVAEYHRQPEQRRAIVDVLRKTLSPPPPSASDAPAPTGPVPYAASGNFSVGQQLVHSKFGNMLVSAAGDKWIDVELEDGSKKRLAQKPR